MRFTLSSTALSSSLTTLSKIINSRNSMAILDYFRFEISDGALVVTASDNENVVTTTIPLTESDGNIVLAIPYRTSLDALKELPEQPLTIEVDPATFMVKVTYQNGEYSFTGVSADEYPPTQSLSDSATTITLDSAILSNNITRSLFATAEHEELRPVMTGIYFDLTADCLCIVASDGHKLVRNKNFTVKSDIPASFILPKKPASFLKNTLGKDDGEVTIQFDNRNARFTYGDTVLTCRLIESRYPNYNSVIPDNNPNRVTVDRRALQSVLRRVMVFASESSQLIRFRIDSGMIELSAEDFDFATSAKESLTCDYFGRSMSIGFKGSSLIDILNNLESDEVVLELADPSRAGVVIPAVQPEDEEVLMLIMPMLLND